MGRPLKFSSAEELQEKIDNYFKHCDEECKLFVDEKTGKSKVIYKPYTVSGLAVYLDTTRDLLIDYAEKDEFSDTVKRAKAKIAASLEERTLTGAYNSTFAIFSFKNNFGWRDKQEVSDTTQQDYEQYLKSKSKDDK